MNPELLERIKAVLPKAIVPNLTTNQAADLYEAYIWSLVIRAAQSNGATVSFIDRSRNKITSQFIFRTAPGHIYSETRPYGHALINFPNHDLLEAHTGIYVAGKSKLRHECDVAVVNHTEAEDCRQKRRNPRYSKVLLAVECKFYVASPIGIDLARSFLGLEADIRHDARYFVGNRPTLHAQALLTQHKKEWRTGVSPLNIQQHDYLQSDFAKVFRNYISKSR